MITTRHLVTPATVGPALDSAFVQARPSTDRPGCVEFSGWIAARSSPVVAVELEHQATVIARATVDRSVSGTPDVSREDAGPNATGFRITDGPVGLAPLNVDVYAVLNDHTRVQIAAAQVQRIWPRSLNVVSAPFVSVIIPCFDSSRFLAEAIESVLSQTYPHIETIVVDDGSHDNAVAVVGRYPGVTYLTHSNRGVSASRNAGLDRSRGSFIVFLDADDRLRPAAVEVGLTHLATAPAAAFVSGQCTHIDAAGHELPAVIAQIVDHDPYQALLRNCYIWTSGAVMFRRGVFDAIGRFDSSLSHSADHDLFFRVAHRFKVGCHGEIVAEYRRHGGNMTRNPGASLRERISVLRRQRSLVAAGPPEWHHAYRDGLAFAREYYGKPVIATVVSDVATGAYARALRSFLTLLTCHPRGAWQALGWLVRQIRLPRVVVGARHGASPGHEA